KIVFIIVNDTGYPNVRVDVINVWKNMPVVRSFDSIGLLYNGFTMTSAQGRQWYNTSSNPNTQYVSYGYQGANMKISTSGQKGVSISQNIIDDLGSLLQNDLYVYGRLESNTQMAASYQHAVTSITLATSHNFT